MAIKTIDIITDDIDGTELEQGTPAIRLAYGNTTVDLHLTDKNAAKLEKAIAPYLEAGTKVTGRSTGRAKASGPKPSDVRAWAAENGIEVPARGRIPASVLEAYNAR